MTVNHYYIIIPNFSIPIFKRPVNSNKFRYSIIIPYLDTSLKIIMIDATNLSVAPDYCVRTYSIAFSHYYVIMNNCGLMNYITINIQKIGIIIFAENTREFIFYYRRINDRCIFP